MSLILTAGNSGSRTFTPAPEGTHQAVLCDIVDLGEQENNFGQTKHFIRVVFQLEEAMENGKPYIVGQRFNATLHEKGALRKFIVASRGRQFSDEELAGFDIESLIGTNVQITVIHNKAENGNTYANIASVSPWNPKFGPELEVRDYTRKKDRDDAEPQTQAAAAGAGGGKKKGDDIPF